MKQTQYGASTTGSVYIAKVAEAAAPELMYEWLQANITEPWGRGETVLALIPLHSKNHYFLLVIQQVGSHRVIQILDSFGYNQYTMGRKKYVDDMVRHIKDNNLLPGLQDFHEARFLEGIQQFGNWEARS